MVGLCVLVVFLYGCNLYILNLGDSWVIFVILKFFVNVVMVVNKSFLYVVELIECYVVEDVWEWEWVISEYFEDFWVISNGCLKGKFCVICVFGVGYLKKVILLN